jgi:L-arabinose isomerase
MTPQLKIGLFAIGLDTYWDQFDGLKERLENHVFKVEDKLKEKNTQVVNLGLIDNSTAKI